MNWTNWPDKKLRKYLLPLFIDHCRRLDPGVVLQEFKNLEGRDFGSWTASETQVKSCVDHIFNVRSRSRDWVIESIKALEPHPDPRFEDEPVHLFMPADTVDTSQGGHDDADTAQGSARDPVDGAETSENARKRGRGRQGIPVPVDFAAMADANAEKVRNLQKDLDESQAHAASLENMCTNLNVEYAGARGAAATEIRDLNQRLAELRAELEEETRQLQDALAQANARPQERSGPFHPTDDGVSSSAYDAELGEEALKAYIQNAVREKHRLMFAKVQREIKIIEAAIRETRSSEPTREEIDRAHAAIPSLVPTPPVPTIDLTRTDRRFAQEEIYEMIRSMTLR